MNLRDILIHLKWGVIRGACVGTAFSVFVALKGAVYGKEMVAAYHISIAMLVALYIVGGIVGGAVVGIAKPLTRFTPGILLVSLAAAVPLAIGFRIAMAGFAPWNAGDYIGVFMGALVMSIIPAGLMLDPKSPTKRIR